MGTLKWTNCRRRQTFSDPLNPTNNWMYRSCISKTSNPWLCALAKKSEIWEFAQQCVCMSVPVPTIHSPKSKCRRYTQNPNIHNTNSVSASWSLIELGSQQASSSRKHQMWCAELYTTWLFHIKSYGNQNNTGLCMLQISESAAKIEPVIWRACHNIPFKTRW